ncbi:MAG TPA: hypothetical protein VFY42_07750, partial [Gemmatimonadales bacterium]|nr:hypothetical protein [Gemmatimonadales bacterium]
MPVSRLHSLLLASLLGSTPLDTQQRPCDTPSSLGPSRDLYCMELIPAPGTAGISGRVELGHPPGLFTVAVSPDGRSRFQLILQASGLPAPSSLGRYRSFVAWVMPPTMDSVVSRRVVGNGRTTIGIVDLEKFTV